MMSPAILLIAGLFLILGGLVLGRALLRLNRQTGMDARLIKWIELDDALARRLTVGITDNIAARAEAIGRRLVSPGDEQDELVHNLAAAGFLDRRAIFIFTAGRLILSIGVALALVLFFLARNEAIVPLLAYSFLGFVFSWFGAITILRRVATNRATRIRSELPFVLDLFVLSLRSGLSIDQTLRHVGQMIDGPAPTIRKMMDLMVAELDVGTAYDDALLKWGDRLAVEEGRDIAALFRQSLTHGTELAESLAAYALDLSDKRAVTAKESIGRISAQLTVVMILFFLPSLVLLVAAPAVTGVTDAFANMGPNQ